MSEQERRPDHLLESANEPGAERLLAAGSRADEEHFTNVRTYVVQALALLGAPLAWFIGFNLDYLLVRSACSSDTMLPLHLVTVATMALTIGSGFAAHHEWRRAGRGWPGAADGPVARTRFIGVLGMLAAAYFVLVIGAEWLAKLFLDPCMAI